MERLLILETSQKVGTVALAEGERVRAERRLEEARRHARDLAPYARDLLAEQGWTARDLAGVVVSLGPGSYTGLRVGVMSAKALAYATGAALIGVETFAPLALQAPEDAPLVDVLEDAQQGRVYVQRFERSEGVLRAAAPLRILSFAEWAAQAPPGLCATGPGLALHRTAPPGVTLTTEDHWRPAAASLLRLALPRLRAGERDDLYRLEPLYLRPSEAEQKWRR
ncbi:MAG: tRNA (adenosine(37)-N6)-threonylcarbamoyltransferase complex dimerization subunit type 1 TsaB [Gemmataceae bacterium]